MGITKFGASSVKTESLGATQIKNYSILPEDLAPGIFTGLIFADGSIPFTKLNTNAKLTLTAGISISPYADFGVTGPQATPATGYGRLYVATDKLPHFINDVGQEIVLGAGGSGTIGPTGPMGPTGIGMTGATGDNGLTYIYEYRAYEVQNPI